MKLAKLIVLHIMAAPALLLGYLYVGFTLGTFMAHKPTVEAPGLIIRAHWRPWLKRAWASIPSFTLGYGFVLSSEKHTDHERVHVRQFQDCASQGFVLATSFSVFLLNAWALMVWPAMLVTMLVLYLTAWLRGSSNMMTEPEHERSAYAQTR